MDYVLDTNTIVHYLHKEANVLRNFSNAALHQCKFIIPTPIDYEIRRGFSVYPAPQKEATYDIFVEQCEIANLEIDVWAYATDVYKLLYNKRLTIGEIDVLIAAFCLVNDYTLVTNNTKDFQNIDGLKIVDWVKVCN